MSTLKLLIVLFLNFNDFTNDFSVKLKQTFLENDAYKTNHFFDSKIEIRIDSENVYFKKSESSQATEILNIFFIKYPVKGFSISQKVDLNNSNSFYTGEYKATTGHQFRVYVLAKKKLDGDFLIETLQIRNK